MSAFARRRSPIDAAFFFTKVSDKKINTGLIPKWHQSSSLMLWQTEDN
ncbi:hypothetical protein FORC88_4144 [Salmonella enterica subsp. enterica serovar Typhimurium]|uniref:Uncharacterized protein n=1 Tax=Salmonella enterica subsp. enterica serovar Urbana str. R8-2977 TaxID=913084 RepID=G5S4F5_SALET|nr:hypothetical protein LTSEJOH_2101 [Salmonella enterica subsp. enterica serovar Johannesburg str. S5-703]EHC97061.1 hypothetical protein LTSEURB_6334 [Salmonella enterica subsp. enterica serovar Urbana str. R8-2977]QCK21294.1 hypothetical protein FORC88_4144 [Salmonella enterica subsp. enterica serovar Typhimurium]